MSNMTQEEQTYYMLRGIISGMPTDDRNKVEAAISEIQAAMDKYGEHGQAAIGLVGAKVAAEIKD